MVHWHFCCLLTPFVAYAAFTDEFFQAFDRLGLAHWEGMEMDAPFRDWAHFVYRANARIGVAIPPCVRVLTHAASMPDQLLGEIASPWLFK